MNHIFEQSPNGLCALCGLSLRLCTKAQERRNQKAATETLSKQAVVFGQQVPTTCQVVQIATTSQVTVVVTTAGQVYTWGEDCHALGRRVNSQSDAHQINLVPALRAHFVAKVSCGESHVLALLNTFVVWSWGDNDRGQLGIGSCRVAENPLLVEGKLVSKVVIDVVAAANTSFASTLGSEVFMWGDNTHLILEGDIMIKESGHFGHFLPEECARIGAISTPVQLKEKRTYVGEPGEAADLAPGEEDKEAPELAEGVPSAEDLSIAVDPEGRLKLFESKSGLEVLSATISQEAVSSMTQENADLRYRLKELQAKYEYIDYSKDEMPAKWVKNEDLKILEVEIQRLKTLLHESLKKSEQIRDELDRAKGELRRLKGKKQELTNDQEKRWEQLKQQYSGATTDDASGPSANDMLMQAAMMSAKTDELINEVRGRRRKLKEERDVHRREEDTVRQQINVHNGMKFIIRKDMAYREFDFGVESEQKRIDELLRLQDEINSLKVISAIQPPISKEELENIISEVNQERAKLMSLNYPVPSALFEAVSKTRNVLVAHLDLLSYLLHIKEVDPERRMMVDDQIMEDFTWGPKVG